MSMPAGWYDDPFTDHLQRYWTGDSWTKETRVRTDVEAAPPAVAPPVPPPIPGAPATGQPVIRDWLIPSILALVFCAWPLAIPALVFAVKANTSKKKGDFETATRLSERAKLFVLLSVALGVVVWIYLAYVIATADVPIDPGTPTSPFGT